MNRYKVSATTLNVRGSPGIEGRILGFVQAGEMLGERDRSQDRLWIKISTDLGEGWVSTKWLIPVPEGDAGVPPWFALANQEIGVAELPGSPTNPRVAEYFQSSIGAVPEKGDETAWCSAFVNWVVETSGIEGTNSLAARSWEKWGDRLASPKVGAIVVFSRTDPENPRAGHVGFYVSATQNGQILVLGGNQGNRVGISSYPVDGLKGSSTYKLLGFRWPGGMSSRARGPALPLGIIRRI